jgi:hypothetical protein
LAQRGRKKKKQRKPRPAGGGGGSLASGYSRTEAKNQAVRDQLVPLDEGERPLPVTIGAIVAVVLVVIQIPLFLAFDGDKRPPLTTFLFFMALMLVMAWGMWTVRYWAVLGFQALLALAILAAALSLMVASNVLAAFVCLVILLPASWLFYKMVKALARIQMPKPGQ